MSKISELETKASAVPITPELLAIASVLNFTPSRLHLEVYGNPTDGLFKVKDEVGKGVLFVQIMLGEDIKSASFKDGFSVNNCPMPSAPNCVTNDSLKAIGMPPPPPGIPGIDPKFNNEFIRPHSASKCIQILKDAQALIKLTAEWVGMARKKAAEEDPFGNYCASQFLSNPRYPNYCIGSFSPSILTYENEELAYPATPKPAPSTIPFTPADPTPLNAFSNLTVAPSSTLGSLSLGNGNTNETSSIASSRVSATPANNITHANGIALSNEGLELLAIAAAAAVDQTTKSANPKPCTNGSGDACLACPTPCSPNRGTTDIEDIVMSTNRSTPADDGESTIGRKRPRVSAFSVSTRVPEHTDEAMSKALILHPVCSNYAIANQLSALVPTGPRYDPRLEPGPQRYDSRLEPGPHRYDPRLDVGVSDPPIIERRTIWNRPSTPFPRTRDGSFPRTKESFACGSRFNPRAAPYVPLASGHGSTINNWREAVERQGYRRN